MGSELRDGVARRRDRRGGFADSAVRVWDMNKAVPGGADVYETDPESRARRAAKDAEMDAPAAGARRGRRRRDDGGRGEAAFR